MVEEHTINNSGQIIYVAASHFLLELAGGIKARNIMPTFNGFDNIKNLKASEIATEMPWVTTFKLKSK